jgi:DNA polymerase elongation subunit (family B)
MSQAKVLVFDIESSPLIVHAWGTRDQNIPLNMIKQDWAVIAWAAKWLGEPASKVIYRDQRSAKNVLDDKAILRVLWKLLDEADIVITQNGKNFDSPKLNARFIQHGMKPPSSYQHLDTYQIAKRVGKFTSNKLEYLTEKLCTKYKKLKHKKFPGFSLWDECLKGNKAAWDEMKKYNVHDVLSTEELYMKLRAWAPSTVPAIYSQDHGDLVCRTCGGEQFRSHGTRIVNGHPYRRLQCKKCGAHVPPKDARIKR